MSQEQPTGSSPETHPDATAPVPPPASDPNAPATGAAPAYGTEPPAPATGPAPAYGTEPPAPATGPAPAYGTEPPPPATGPAPAYPSGPPASQQPAYAQGGDQAAYPPPVPPEGGYAPPGHAAPAPGTAVAAGGQPMTPDQERTGGLAAHGITLAATIFSGGTLSFIAALVMYLALKEKGPFVRRNTANALNIQITVAIGYLIGGLLAVTIIGLIVALPLFAALFVYAVVTHIIGMVKANNGEWWDPPLTYTFVR